MATSDEKLPTNKVGIELGGKKLDVNVVNITVTPRSQITNAPIAGNGEVKYIVDLPTRIVCRCALRIDHDDKWISTLNRIQAFYNRTEIDPSNYDHLAQVTTRTDVYYRCTLVSCPHEETVESYDTYYFTLTFEELITI